MTETIDGTEEGIETETEEATENAAVRDPLTTARVAITARWTLTLPVETTEPVSARIDTVVRAVVAEIAETETGIAIAVDAGAMMTEALEEAATCLKTEEEAPDVTIDEAARTATSLHNKLAPVVVAALLQRNENLLPT
jgi:hypothetical protein